MVKTEMLNKESDSEGLTGIHTIMAWIEKERTATAVREVGIPEGCQLNQKTDFSSVPKRDLPMVP